MNVQVALFPDLSSAVYVITWFPWLNVWGDWKFEVTLGVNPEVSVATGFVQFTRAEKVPFSAYDSNKFQGHDPPNDGAWESKESK